MTLEIVCPAGKKETYSTTCPDNNKWGEGDLKLMYRLYKDKGYQVRWR